MPSTKSESLRVPMRDGVELSVHVHRPETEEPVPAIVGYTPYRKGQLGSPPPIVGHGFASVTWDIRGTGSSGGWNDSIYSGPERQDGYDMIEWVAGQTWCNGNVGMWGMSFGAVVALQMAGAAPPHLKAIIARSGTDDPYTEWTQPGGSPRPYMYTCYGPIMTASNFSPPDPAEVGEDWEEIWAERLERNVPWAIPFIRNLEDGPFWRDRSLRDKYDRVQCAVFVVGGWADWYHTPLLRTFANLNGPRRALIGPWSHQWPEGGIPGPRIDWLPEAVRWFDYWLKGEDNGVMDEPPVTVFVREYDKPATIRAEDRGVFRCENEWPPARTLETPMYLRSGGNLTTQALDDETADGSDALEYDPRVGGNGGMHGGGPFNINWARPLDQRADEVDSLTYTSEPLDKETEVTGLPRAVLHFSSTAPISFLSVKLCDVSPDGTSALITKGYLNVTHRDSHSTPSHIEPGRIYEVDIELLACAYHIEKGHRIRLDIAGADFLNAWPTPASCINTIYYNAEHPSRIILPIVPTRSPALPEPALRISPDGPPQIDKLTPPKFSIARNPIEETACLEYSAAYGHGWEHAASYTVSARDPALTVVHANARREFDYSDRRIVVDAHCDTTSDKLSFYHAVDVKITVNDEQFFSKNWSESVPRGHC